MGFNTTVLIHNDRLGDIARDKGFGVRLSGAIAEAYGAKEPFYFSGGYVVEQHHADDTSLVAFGGNTATHLLTVSGRFHQDNEMQVELLKELARKLGYRLVKHK